MTPRSSTPLPTPLEQLVDRLLESADTGGLLDVFQVAAAARALTERGIKARAMSTNVVLDPEQWERPYSLVALSVRGRIYAGHGRYGWEAIAEAFREHEGIGGDYCDIGRAYAIDWDGLSSLNPTRLAQLSLELNRCRSQVEQQHFDKRTPAARHPGRGGMPRL